MISNRKIAIKIPLFSRPEPNPKHHDREFFSAESPLKLPHGLNKIVTWSGRTSEIEFVLEIDGKIVPVEVKSGFNTKAKSLQAFINKYNPSCSIKFTGNKFGFDRQKKIFNYPLYMISKFPELCLNPDCPAHPV